MTDVENIIKSLGIKSKEELQKEKLENSQLQLVVKSNSLIQETRYELSTQEQKLIIYLVSLIKPKYEEFQEFSIDVKEVCNIMGITEHYQNYANLKSSLKTLADKSFWIATPEKEYLFRWLERLEIDKTQTKVLCRFDERLKPYLLKLRESFTAFNLCYVLALKSKYAIRLYELFHSYLYRKEFQLTLDEIRKMLKLEDKYAEYKELNRNVIKRAVDEINEYTDLSVNYKPIREGKRVVAVEFKLHFTGDDITQQTALEQLSLDEV